ncbi:unnamed protein product [Durusdinium trenchii]|uniref:Uncharacterized protein n=1 Tax=Durusdinium trenchii TaxID=1381693 RepID=A0ABP0SC65_9DINO
METTESINARTRPLLYVLTLWSPMLLGFTAYESQLFLTSLSISQHQQLGKCFDGRRAGESVADAEFGLRPQELTLKEKLEPSTDLPQVLCKIPVFVYQCPTWATTFAECTEDEELPLWRRTRTKETGVFCWGEPGLYWFGTEPCSAKIWNCSTGACSGYLKSARLCASDLEAKAYPCYFDPTDADAGAQRNRFVYWTYTGLLSLFLGLLSTFCLCTIVYITRHTLWQLCMSGPRACAQSVCSPMAKFGYLLVAICSTIIILEWVIMVLIMPGQTGYSLLGAGIMPATHEGMQVKSLEPGWESEAEVPKGFNEPSFMAKFARIFMLVMQIYVGIGLLVLCIYVALKCGAFRRSADTANGYQRMEQPSRQTNE